MPYGLHVQNEKFTDDLTFCFSVYADSTCLKLIMCVLELKELYPNKYNRAEVIQSFRWKVGPVLPHDIQEKLHFSEKEYFKNHSAAIKSYISEMDIDLTVVWCFFYFLCFTRDERFIRLLIPFITGHGSSQGSLHSGSGAGGHW